MYLTQSLSLKRFVYWVPCLASEAAYDWIMSFFVKNSKRTVKRLRTEGSEECTRQRAMWICGREAVRILGCQNGNTWLANSRSSLLRHIQESYFRAKVVANSSMVVLISSCVCHRVYVIHTKMRTTRPCENVLQVLSTLDRSLEMYDWRGLIKGRQSAWFRAKHPSKAV